MGMTTTPRTVVLLQSLDGVTWTLRGTIAAMSANPARAHGFDETDIAWLPGGRLIAAGGAAQPWQGMGTAFSDDRGVTWSLMAHHYGMNLNNPTLFPLSDDLIAVFGRKPIVADPVPWGETGVAVGIIDRDGNVVAGARGVRPALLQVRRRVCGVPGRRRPAVLRAVLHRPERRQPGGRRRAVGASEPGGAAPDEPGRAAAPAGPGAGARALAGQLGNVEHSFDRAAICTAATIYVYDSAAHATTHDGTTGLLYRYAVSATIAQGRSTQAKQIRQR